MDTVVYDRIEDVLGRIESLYGRVEDTYLVAKDILLGTQISDWIADLKASGTASATYSDASRMNVLIANEDAANNSDVAKYLVQWAVANNKFGTYCGGACGTVSGVTWDSLTTPNAVAANATAFTALCGNSVAIYEVLKVKVCKQAIWANLTICDTIIRGSNTAMSALEKLCSNITFRVDKASQGKWFVHRVNSYNDPPLSVKITYAPGGEKDQLVVHGNGTALYIKRFATSLQSVGVTSMDACAVDFS